MPSSTGGRWVIRPGEAADLPAVRALLERCGLPAAGLEDADTILIAHREGVLVGSAAFERYGDRGLLRSVAVGTAERGAGLGVALTRAALDAARERGVRRLFLLTETADRFFPRFGFRALPREEVDAAVQESVEFREACPASARAMILDL